MSIKRKSFRITASSNPNRVNTFIKLDNMKHKPQPIQVNPYITIMGLKW